MSFREKAKCLIGRSVEVQLGSGSSLRGRLTSVGSDFVVMHVRRGRRIRRVIVRLAEIAFLFALFGI
ncbi:hypothetical protein GCM10010916_28340 [Paenibacillus abyssi]|uniref:Uncharacterized protein n=1 Tax=Paenibacillus abyssi TaxID=1340531 RepID=A0A917FUE3_9BACL|nr:hypothetical protein GCM10010916_28340 [Paenibacillus abyssi]